MLPLATLGSALMLELIADFKTKGNRIHIEGLPDEVYAAFQERACIELGQDPNNPDPNKPAGAVMVLRLIEHFIEPNSTTYMLAKIPHAARIALEQTCNDLMADYLSEPNTRQFSTDDLFSAMFASASYGALSLMVINPNEVRSSNHTMVLMNVPKSAYAALETLGENIKSHFQLLKPMDGKITASHALGMLIEMAGDGFITFDSNAVDVAKTLAEAGVGNTNAGNDGQAQPMEAT